MAMKLEDRNVSASVSFSPEVLRRLDAITSETGVTRSRLIDRLLKKGLGLEKDNGNPQKNNAQ